MGDKLDRATRLVRGAGEALREYNWRKRQLLTIKRTPDEIYCCLALAAICGECGGELENSEERGRVG